MRERCPHLAKRRVPGANSFWSERGGGAIFGPSGAIRLARGVSPCAGVRDVSKPEPRPRFGETSVSEFPNRPFAAASQITTETVSPVAIVNSGAGRCSLKRSRNTGRGRAASTSSTTSSILTTLKAISPCWFACATTSSRSGKFEQPANHSVSADAPARIADRIPGKRTTGKRCPPTSAPQSPREQPRANRRVVEYLSCRSIARKTPLCISVSMSKSKLRPAVAVGKRDFR